MAYYICRLILEMWTYKLQWNNSSSFCSTNNLYLNPEIFEKYSHTDVRKYVNVWCKIIFALILQRCVMGSLYVVNVVNNIRTVASLIKTLLLQFGEPTFLLGRKPWKVPVKAPDPCRNINFLNFKAYNLLLGLVISRNLKWLYKVNISCMY